MKQAIVTLFVMLMGAPMAAQWLKHPTPGIPRTADGKPNLTAPAPKTADGKPDVSGTWQIDGLGYAFNIIGDKGPEMLAWAQALYKQRADNYWKDDTDVRCLPPGPRAGLFSQNLLKIVQTPGLILVLYEQAPTRQIFTDGRELPRDPNPTWMGYSVGHWEGDTLVVDTTNFSPKTFYRGAHENLHLVERFRRTDVETMEYSVRIDDPTTWVQPWTVKVDLRKNADRFNRIFESTCHEGNYGLTGMLANTRAAERAFAAGKGPDPAAMNLAIGGAGGAGDPFEGGSE